ncbi:hypothetical protein KAR91_11080 [Candidatus Pacearchaeota archaeon]|nr:hypothetical protein [Candidatus Pacearchaeota archaeon]
MIIKEDHLKRLHELPWGNSIWALKIATFGHVFDADYKNIYEKLKKGDIIYVFSSVPTRAITVTAIDKDPVHVHVSTYSHTP